MSLNKKILIFGGNGLVGTAISDLLKSKNHQIFAPRSKDVNLLNLDQVLKSFDQFQPDIALNCAGQVGGIYFNNTDRWNFLYKNTLMELNFSEACRIHKPSTTVFYGSSCIYPKFAEQPIKESSLLTSLLEPTNEAYALAKITGLKLMDYLAELTEKRCFSVMPCNVYGPNDTYHIQNSHVIPALIMKFESAKRQNQGYVEVWGTGSPLREFIHCQDLAEAVALLLESSIKHPSIVNLGTGNEISIKNLALKIASHVGYQGDIKFNEQFPDGTPRKVLDNSYINSLGFKPKVDLDTGLKFAIQDYRNRF